MKKMISKIPTSFLFNLLLFTATINIVSAQCPTGIAPTYASSCTNEYITDISATGAGVVSTISVTGGTCGGTTYFSDYATQGVTVAAGSIVNINFTKYTTTYTGLLYVYVDWNNDGSYDPVTELVGTMMTLPPSMPSAIYSFMVPTTGIVPGVNLNMRVFLSETTGTTSAPCTGSYGQAYDFYLNATCPPLAIAILPAPDTICSGGSGILTASGIGTGSTYTWLPSTGLSDTTGDTVTASPDTTSKYILTGTSSIGCSYTDSVTVVVIPGGGPADTIIAADTTRFCHGDSVWLHGSSGVGYAYQWYNGVVAVSGATDSSYKATTSGSYALKITIPSGCSSMSLPIVVTVFNPIPLITFDGKTFHTASYFRTYQWYENGTAITGATHDSTIAHSNGNYTVKVTDTNGCTGTSAVYPLTHLAVQTVTNTGTITIYPNPATNIIYIESPVTLNALITTADGKAITQQKAARSIDISYFPTGIYLIELSDESGHRLVIQKLIKN